MGCVGTGEAGDRRRALDVQESEVPRQPRRTVQAPGGLARSAQPRLQRSHSQGDGANARGNANGKDAGRGGLEFVLESASFRYMAGECRSMLGRVPNSLPHSL